MRRSGLVLCLMYCMHGVSAQVASDPGDTTAMVGKGIILMDRKQERAGIGAYIQPQYQVASANGAKGFSGGDFPANVSNRFMIRLGGLRFDYDRYTEDHKPMIHFVFQFEGTERGVSIRDLYGRYYENKWELFHFSMGMFVRPFGYEVTRPNRDLESPERGRMSQLLMKNERDIGAMISFEPRKKDNPFRNIRIDAGFFNGQGLSAPADYDNYKDFIARALLKPVLVSRNVWLSGGLSMLNGGFLQNTQTMYYTRTDAAGNKAVLADSSQGNIGREAPRKYYGADMQWKIKSGWGFSEFRAEYIQGTQTGISSSSETPATLLFEPSYVRHFNGGYFYYLQNILSEKHQLIVKYDWYDPNTDVKGMDIGKPGANINATNIKYSTIGLGYLYYVNVNVKWSVWYDIVKNEKTQLAGYTSDLKDNVFTFRVQFRF